MSRRAFLPVAVAACLFQSQVALAQSEDNAARAAAIDLFDTAESLLDSGRVAEACPKYAESYRLEPQLGALLHLADCLEREGRLASAYAAFRDAVELAANRRDDRERYAEARSQQLLPRLGRIALRVSASARVPGLRLMLGPLRIDHGSFGVGIAVDPGRHRIEASAPGRAPYLIDVSIDREGQLEEIAIPTLALLPSTAPPELTTTEPEPTVNAARLADKPARDRTALRRAGLVTAGAGVLALGVGVGFLIDMFSTLEDRDAVCPSNPCPSGTDRSQVSALEADARRSQTLGIVFSSVGGVLVLSGATMAWVVPRIDTKGAGGDNFPWAAGRRYVLSPMRTARHVTSALRPSMYALGAALLVVSCFTAREYEDAAPEAVAGGGASGSAGGVPSGSAGDAGASDRGGDGGFGGTEAGSAGDSNTPLGGSSGRGDTGGDAGGIGGVHAGGIGGVHAAGLSGAGEPHAPSSLTVNVMFPGDHAAVVEVTGPKGFHATVSKTSTLSDLASGSYSVSARPVHVPGPIVGAMFDGVVVGSPAPVDSESAAEVSVTYRRRPGTGRVLLTSDARALVSVDAAELASQGSLEAAAPALLLPTVGARSFGVAADLRGNVWVGDCANGQLTRFSPQQLVTGGEQNPELTLTINGVIGPGCPSSLLPRADGGLVVADYNNRVFLLKPEQLTQSGIVTPTFIALDDAYGIHQIALDAQGGLWFSAYQSSLVGRLSAASVAGGTAQLAARWDGGAGQAIHHPIGLAISPTGQVWVANNASLQVSAFAADAQTLPEPLVSFTSSALDDPAMMTFDASGNLWIVNNNPGKLLRFDAADLATSGSKTPSLVVTAGGVAHGAGIFFNPTLPVAGSSQSQ